MSERDASRWYDAIADVYDLCAEGVYAPMRETTVRQLQLEPGDSVLDVACGTGVNFGFVLPEIGPDGLIVGVDASSGMLERARERLETMRRGADRVRLERMEAGRLDHRDLLASEAFDGGFDRLVSTLGLTVIPDWERAFEGAWSALRPGGRAAVMDAYFDEARLCRRLVDFIGDSDTSRRFWEPLKRASEDYEEHEFDFPILGGGVVRVASGRKPAP